MIFIGSIEYKETCFDDKEMELVAIDLQRQMHNLDDDQHSSSLGFSLYVLEAFISSETNKLN